VLNISKINKVRFEKLLPGGIRKSFTLSEKQSKEPIENISSESLAKKEQHIEDLLSTGVINLNKPMGPTSHQVSSWVKLIFDVKKVGHGGTLDPRVTGVLPLAFGSTARILNVLTYSSKEYVGVMRLHNNLPIKRIKQVCCEFIGPIYQFPPVRSAVKRQLRVRTIYSLEILEHKGRDVLIKVVCEAGTYIRSLINDIGLVLGSGAHMQELRRTRTGAFHECDSVTLHELKDALVFWQDQQEESLLRNCIKPMETLLLDLPKIVIHDSAVDAVCHGADLAVPGILLFEEIKCTGQPVAIYTHKGEGVAIGKALMVTDDILNTKSGIALKTTRVLMSPGTYKKGWKTND